MGEALSLVTKGKAPVSRSVSLRTRRGDGCEEMAGKGDGTLLEKQICIHLKSVNSGKSAVLESRYSS